jgi:hypothetical protein
MRKSYYQKAGALTPMFSTGGESYEESYLLAAGSCHGDRNGWLFQ